MIDVNTDTISAVMIGADWWNVAPGTLEIDYAEYHDGPIDRFGRGLHIAFTVAGGPHNGARLVARAADVTAIRTP